MRQLSANFTVVLCLLIFSVFVLADQAAWIIKAQAKKAVVLLKKQKQIKYYCPPCEDKSITSEEISTVQARAVKGKYREVKINAEEIDLAYVYFKNSSGKWKNLAFELTIEVSDVPTFLPEK